MTVKDMAKLRAATESDLDALIALAEVMHDESPRFRVYAFMPDRLRVALTTVMRTHLGCAFVVEQDGQITGGFAAIAHPHFACDVLQACDVGLFISPEHRGGTAAAKLIHAYLNWARSIEAEPTISINTGVEVERTGQLFHALGAKQSGFNWTWGI